MIVCNTKRKLETFQTCIRDQKIFMNISRGDFFVILSMNKLHSVR